MRHKSPEAFRTISEVAEQLELPQHVLRFWETRFAQIRPMKRGGGRRYYRPEDVALLRGIRHLLYEDGYTIKGVQRILKERGPRQVAQSWRPSGAVDAAEDEEFETDERLADEVVPTHDPRPYGDPEPPEPYVAAAALDGGSAESIDAAGALAEAPDSYQPPPLTETDHERLSGEAGRVLQALLIELKDCRRILDEARQRS